MEKFFVSKIGQEMISCLKYTAYVKQYLKYEKIEFSILKCFLLTFLVLFFKGGGVIFSTILSNFCSRNRRDKHILMFGPKKTKTGQTPDIQSTSNFQEKTFKYHMMAL